MHQQKWFVFLSLFVSKVVAMDQSYKDPSINPLREVTENIENHLGFVNCFSKICLEDLGSAYPKEVWGLIWTHLDVKSKVRICGTNKLSSDIMRCFKDSILVRWMENFLTTPNNLGGFTSYHPFYTPFDDFEKFSKCRYLKQAHSHFSATVKCIEDFDLFIRNFSELKQRNLQSSYSVKFKAIEQKIFDIDTLMTDFLQHKVKVDMLKKADKAAYVRLCQKRGIFVDHFVELEKDANFDQDVMANATPVEGHYYCLIS